MANKVHWKLINANSVQIFSLHTSCAPLEDLLRPPPPGGGGAPHTLRTTAVGGNSLRMASTFWKGRQFNSCDCYGHVMLFLCYVIPYYIYYIKHNERRNFLPLILLLILALDTLQLNYDMKLVKHYWNVISRYSCTDCRHRHTILHPLTLFSKGRLQKGTFMSWLPPSPCAPPPHTHTPISSNQLTNFQET
jgi:hypothetical protein